MKKPQQSGCDRMILQGEVPTNYMPFKNRGEKTEESRLQKKVVFKGAPQFNSRGEIIDKQVYFTVQADESEVNGRLHVKSDITMA